MTIQEGELDTVLFDLDKISETVSSGSLIHCESIKQAHDIIMILKSMGYEVAPNGYCDDILWGNAKYKLYKDAGVIRDKICFWRSGNWGKTVVDYSDVVSKITDRLNTQSTNSHSDKEDDFCEMIKSLIY